MTIEQVTNKQRDALMKTACEIRERAYAPYSKYRVGAALLADDGNVYSGANVENAVYGLGICAERVAIFTAVANGARGILAIAVCTENMGTPCGACRQVLTEFAGDIPIWLCDGQGNVQQTWCQVLLPDQFGPDDLPGGKQ